MAWTEEMCSALEEGIRAGLSYTKIGKRLGVSRNAAVGKAHRLGIADLSLRRPGFDRKPAVKRNFKRMVPKRARPAKPVQVKPIALPEPKTRAILLEAIEPGECKWPVNDAQPGEEHLFCGVPHGREAQEQPYCDYHMQRNVSRDGGRHLSMLERGK